MNKNKIELRIEKYRDLIRAMFILLGWLGGWIQLLEVLIDIFK